MAEVTREDVVAWLGPAADEVDEGQVQAMVAAWGAYLSSPVVMARGGEAGDFEEEDRAVINAIGAQVLGDDVGLGAMGGALRAAKAELYASIAGATYAGMSEAEAARLAGVDRMTVRRVLGKR